jgi:glycosyltransferase involved in cell wall biosynthesis
MRAAERFQAPRCAAIVAVSNAEKAAGEAAGINPSKLVLIPNGLRTAVRSLEAAPWQDKRIKALFVGRLDRQKGVDVLLEAVSKLQDSVCVRIVGAAVVGSGDQAHSPANVQYLGWLNQEAVAEQINACDLLVMPSRWEGCPLAAIEAMRSAKPVVASAVGGLTEMIVDGMTGRLVPKDDAAALAAALTSQSKSTLERMGRAARERFLAAYSIDKVHESLLGLYSRVRMPADQRSPSTN